MSLRDYQVATRTITITADNKLSVRALGFDDVQHLLINRQGLVEQALALFGGEEGFDPDTADATEMRGFATKLIAALPALCGELIAVGADERAMGEKAMRLPAPVQLEAMVAIYEMTFSEPGSVKKFFDRLADLMTSIPRPTNAKAVNLASLRAGLSASGATLAS